MGIRGVTCGWGKFPSVPKMMGARQKNLPSQAGETTYQVGFFDEFADEYRESSVKTEIDCLINRTSITC